MRGDEERVGGERILGRGKKEGRKGGEKVRSEREGRERESVRKRERVFR